MKGLLVPDSVAPIPAGFAGSPRHRRSPPGVSGAKLKGRGTPRKKRERELGGEKEEANVAVIEL